MRSAARFVEIRREHREASGAGRGGLRSGTGALSAQPLARGQTAWSRNVETPLRQFLRTEIGGAAVLLGAAVAALVWVNLEASSYERLWETTLSIHIGGSGVALELREWVNSGLMTFFFFVIGLEARREFDLGELRERRRFALPLVAGFGGAAVAVAIFLAFNAGRPSAHGWGTAMSTDTAFALGATAWVALLESGVEPVVIGLAMGILPFAYTAERHSLERATERFRAFREQPTAELARSLEAQLRATTSRNERLQQLWHPWTSYGIVPLFALANAGIAIDGGVLARGFTSPITLGIFFGYVVGKPVGVLGGTWLLARASGGRLRPPVGWAAVAGGGTIAGIGFTVSLLIATLAFGGTQLDDAKLGILSAAVGASAVTWLLFRATARLPRQRRARALLGPDSPIVDLYIDVDPERDHVRGPADAPVTVVEYGDFECPFCGRAEPVVRELLREFGDVAYVWRHLPLNDVHANAQLAAEAAEGAAEQGAFWEMHDLLLENQDALDPNHLIDHVERLGLDGERFKAFLREHAGAARVAEDVDGADMSGFSGTPTFFVNGRRHHGAYDIATLSAAVRAAGARATLTTATTD